MPLSVSFTLSLWKDDNLGNFQEKKGNHALLQWIGFVHEQIAIFKALPQDQNLMADPGLWFATNPNSIFLVNEGDFIAF